MLQVLQECHRQGILYAVRRTCRGRRGPVGADTVVYCLALVCGVCRVLVAERGCAVQDIKPSNFLLKQPAGTQPQLEVRVVDFGCSQRIQAVRTRRGLQSTRA